jgi:hypothetical protein
MTHNWIMNEINVIKIKFVETKCKTNGNYNNMRDHSVKTIVGGL